MHRIVERALGIYGRIRCVTLIMERWTNSLSSKEIDCLVEDAASTPLTVEANVEKARIDIVIHFMWTLQFILRPSLRLYVATMPTVAPQSNAV
jgi:hypothetical protein